MVSINACILSCIPLEEFSVYTFDASASQKIARYALICSLMLLGAWMLQHFLPALCWAGVLAIGTSKLYGPLAQPTSGAGTAMCGQR